VKMPSIASKLSTVSWASAMAAFLVISGCDSSDSGPVQKFEKPAGYKDSDTARTPDDVFKRQRQDRGTDGTLRPGKAAPRR